MYPEVKSIESMNSKTATRMMYCLVKLIRATQDLGILLLTAMRAFSLNVSLSPTQFTTVLPIQFFLVIALLCQTQNSFANTRFVSPYPCQNTGKRCVSSGVRTIDGFQVHKDCWEWEYEKTCDYPSKNDCSNYAHCYEVAITKCLLTDSLGNCVNQLKEFSCKRWVPTVKESKKVRIALEEKDGPEGIVCKGIPCIDGNCVNKSYLTNGEMMDSVSKLYLASEAKGATDVNFQICKGDSWHCSKKATAYTNCCATSMSGWGKNFGAECTKDERTLLEKRKNNHCVYVGKKNKQTMGFNTLVKHYWCCFENLFHKVVQVEARKQLYQKGLINLDEKNFGHEDRTICRGLTLDEITKLDFSELDLSEFIEDFKAKFFGKFKMPSVGDMAARVKGTLPNIRKYDGNPYNKTNNMTGWSGGVKDDSWEAEEERRFEEERLRLLREEEAKRNADNAKKAEEARQIELKRQQEEARLAQVRAEEERVRKKANKEREVRTAEQELKAGHEHWNEFVAKKAYWYNGTYGPAERHPDYRRESDKLNNVSTKLKRLKQELINGQY